MLPHISKVFERKIHKQINSYMEDKLSKYITGFRKAHRTQQNLTELNYSRKMEKYFRQRRKFIVYLRLSQKPLIQLITISFW